MREIICMSIGQAGIQISNAIWELFCMEHGIDADGKMKSTSIHDDYYASHSIFRETDGCNFMPRSLMLDLEPNVLDEIRTGVYRNLFNGSLLLSGMEDASSNYARGHYTIGKAHLDDFLSALRRLIEDCESVQGLIIVQSFGGGCGSGFTTLAMEHISVEYNKYHRLLYSIIPGNHSHSIVVEPYNFVLSSHCSTDCTDLSFSFDNYCLNKVVFEKLEIRRPTFTNINRLLAQLFSSVTVPIRYENSLNNDISQMATNLVPYPRLHFPVASYSPVFSNDKTRTYLSTTSQISRDVILPSNCLVEFSNDEDDKILSACLQYRGNVYPGDVNKVIHTVKLGSQLRFVDWCPTGFKIGINKRPPVSPLNSSIFQTDKSVVFLNNCTGFQRKLNSILNKFHLLFAKRSFVHWFVGEGMEEGEFCEAQDNVRCLVDDYRCSSQDDNLDEENVTTDTTKVTEPSKVEIKTAVENEKENEPEFELLVKISSKNSVTRTSLENFETDRDDDEPTTTAVDEDDFDASRRHSEFNAAAGTDDKGTDKETDKGTDKGTDGTDSQGLLSPENIGYESTKGSESVVTL